MINRTFGILESLENRFGQRRVGVHRLRNRFEGRFQLHGHDRLGDQIRHMGSDHVDTEQLAVLPLPHDLHESVLLADRQRRDRRGVPVPREGPDGSLRRTVVTHWRRSRPPSARAARLRGLRRLLALSSRTRQGAQPRITLRGREDP